VQWPVVAGEVHPPPTGICDDVSTPSWESTRATKLPQFQRSGRMEGSILLADNVVGRAS
jgi:hypothetical protein